MLNPVYFEIKLISAPSFFIAVAIEICSACVNSVILIEKILSFFIRCSFNLYLEAIPKTKQLSNWFINLLNHSTKVPSDFTITSLSFINIYCLHS